MSQTVTKSISLGWLNLDIWSEPYVGAHWIITNELPQKQYQFKEHHGPLCQMILLTSHHLNEVIFFQCVKEILKNNPNKHPEIEKKLEKATFTNPFKTWPTKLVGKPFNLNIEPFASTIRLASRRNETIHKQSALTSLEMAKSALYTASISSKAIATHLLGNNGFKYQKVLDKYPINQTKMFSTVTFVEDLLPHKGSNRVGVNLN